MVDARTAVMRPAATARDGRWRRNFVRGTAVAALFGGAALITALTSAHPWRHWLILLAVLAWWGTGLVGALRHSVLVDPALADPVERGLAAWRRLPADVRDRARPVADGLVAAAVRHDTGGVLDRLGLLVRTGREAASRPYPGHRTDVDELQAWLDAAKETHRA